MLNEIKRMIQIHDLLNPETESRPFFVVGKAFFGRKDVSDKDGSYTATLWMTFLNLPVMPYDSYRILNPQASFLPKVFGLDEYILIKSVSIKFDWFQVFWSLITFYIWFVILFFIDLRVFLEYGSPMGLGFILVCLLGYALALFWNHKTINAVHKAVLKPVVEQAKPEVSLQKFVVPEQTTSPELIEVMSEPFAKQNQIKSEPIIPKPTPPKPQMDMRPVSVIRKVEAPVPVAPLHIELPESIPAESSRIELPEPIPVAPSRYEPPKPKPVAHVQAYSQAVSHPNELEHPGQIKFDPNKIMEVKFGEIDMTPKVDLFPHEVMGIADWSGFFVVILLLLQLITKFYFVLGLDKAGNLAQFENIFNLIYTFYILSAVGFVLFIFTIKKSPYIAYPLLILSLAFAFRVERYLFDFLVNF